MKLTRIITIGALLMAPLAVAACSSDSQQSSDSTVATAIEGVMVSKQWARTSPMATDMGAAYFTLNSTQEDALVDVKIDESIAAQVQIHETVMATSDSTMMGSGSTAAPAMKMQEVDEVVLPAEKDIAFAPGGYHVMLMKLKSPLKVGTSINITLVFKNSPEQLITVPVLDEAP